MLGPTEKISEAPASLSGLFLLPTGRPRFLLADWGSSFSMQWSIRNGALHSVNQYAAANRAVSNGIRRAFAGWGYEVVLAVHCMNCPLHPAAGDGALEGLLEEKWVLAAVWGVVADMATGKWWDGSRPEQRPAHHAHMLHQRASPPGHASPTAAASGAWGPWG